MLDNLAILNSDIVANITMNRSRGLAGVNSYTKELRLDVRSWLVERCQDKGRVAWLDVCCGEGRALLQTADELEKLGLLGKAALTGIDLVDWFPEMRQEVELVCGDVNAFEPGRQFDLITCVHGLHYIGDKLGLMGRLSRMLTAGGQLLAHLDPANIRVEGEDALTWASIAKNWTSGKEHLAYKNHILTITGDVEFGLIYRGASTSEKPNYTGITVMDSWYARP